jgi:hypothetical protein
VLAKQSYQELSEIGWFDIPDCTQRPRKKKEFLRPPTYSLYIPIVLGRKMAATTLSTTANLCSNERADTRLGFGSQLFLSSFLEIG